MRCFVVSGSVKGDHREGIVPWHVGVFVARESSASDCTQHQLLRMLAQVDAGERPRRA